MLFPIAIVGANGRMGAMLHESWKSHGRVFCIDRKPAANGDLVLAQEDLHDAVPQCKLVMLCVPAPSMPDVLAAVAPHMREDQLLADVCSVKIRPMRWMQEYFTGPVVGTHPFFGPDNARSNAQTALIQGVNATTAHVNALAELFHHMGCKTFTTTSEEHDRRAAISQSLHFAMAAAYFALAAREDTIEPYLTPSFHRYKTAAQNELTVNAAMFREFTETNPLFAQVLKETQELLAQTAAGGLPALVREAQSWFDPMP